MKETIDVFEILKQNNSKNQEQQNAPDFDFLNVAELMRQMEPAQEPAAPPEPEPVHEPVKAPETVAVPAAVPETPPEPEPEKEPVTVVAPEPEPVHEPVKAPETVAVPAAAPAAPLEPEPVNKHAKSRKMLSAGFIVKTALLAVICVVMLLFVIGFPKISMNSMEPMISDGDRVIVSKLKNDFKKNDIVVFRNTDGRKLAARVVATNGDVVSLNNIGGLYINNELQTEEYIHTVTTITDTLVSYPVIVEKGAYFVLGDNRTDSVDSRNSSIGLVEEKDIIGKVIFCFKKVK